jgi:nicotinate-nucleotide pyrophosphorylase (carboxylating)
MRISVSWAEKRTELFSLFLNFPTLDYTPGYPQVFSERETAACRRLVDLGLEEDLNGKGDLTSQAVIPEGLSGKGVIVARAGGIVAGLPAAGLVALTVSPALVFQPIRQDGTSVRAGLGLAVISGPLHALLAAERLALNFLQRLSGIATLTHRFVAAVAGTEAKILDTRKTTPGWRVLEKYAVRCGGGHNHRLGLYDGILIKDNHLAGLGAQPKPIAQAVTAARARVGYHFPVEVEIERLDQLEEALACNPDIILLDNMAAENLREAVRRRNLVAPNVLLEASGRVSLDTVAAIAHTGVDRISVGSLTHSAPALDIALDYVSP